MPNGTRNFPLLASLTGVLLAAGLPFFAGCPLNSSPITVAQAASPPSSASPATRSILPIPQANIKKAVKRLPGLVKTVMGNTGIPGVAVAVVHDGKTIYAQGFGVRKAGNPALVTPNTVFQIASLSKSISGTVIAKVIYNCEQRTGGCGYYPNDPVSWDMTVNRYLPYFTLSNPYVTKHVTIGDLFSHRSGLPDHAGDGLFTLGFTHQRTILSRLVQLPLNDFRTSYGYTNFGFTAGGLAVAAAMDKPWAELAERVLFAPLDMSSTSYRHNDFLSRSNRAALHVKRDGRWQALYTIDDDPAAPAGGVSTSVKDFAKWMIFVLANDGGCSAKDPSSLACALLPALSPQSLSSPPNKSSTRSGFYGYGFDVSTSMSGRVKLGNSGAFPQGAGTSFQLLPSVDVGIVVLTNASAIGAAETIVGQFEDIVQYGELETDWPTLYRRLFEQVNAPAGDLIGKNGHRPPHPTPPKPDSTYVGTYKSSYFGNAKVVVKNGKLLLLLGPKRKPLEYVLQPWDGDEFAIDIAGPVFPPKSKSSVWFTVGDGGTASQLTVTVFNNSFSSSYNPADAFSPYFRVSNP